MARRAMLGILLAVFLSACASPVGLVGGESVRPLEPEAPVLTLAVVAADDATALPATLTVGEEELETDETGHLAIDWRFDDTGLDIAAAAPGFVAGSTTVAQLPEDGVVTLALEPVVLTGKVVTPDGRALPGTAVTLGRATARSDAEGIFEISRAVAGELQLDRPAWQLSSVAWDGAETDLTLTLEPLMIRALRVAGDKAGDRDTWESLLDLADRTGVNAFVVDTKAEGGTVFHDTEVALAHEIGAVKTFYDLDKIIQDMDDHGLYKITRIVTFQDNFLAKARPEIAARDAESGEPWQNYKGIRWLDPTDRNSWDYALDLADEACRRGFDEIQFDYIRFPSDGPVSQVVFDELRGGDGYYDKETQQFRIETISAFLEEAHSRLNPMGCAVAADIFAITLESRSDEGIGQSPAVFSNYIDVLSPMIYTYTYGPGWKGWEDPNEHAVELVTLALDSGIPRLEGFSVYRPWLQRAFIPDDEILAIQRVAEDRDMGWMLWSANTIFDAGHLPPPE
ncbi:MAG: hypothetical protein HKN91_12240 [Acidimicrobiia bacterium]|nr:hypothetical protein [Acidimicrobiia bacterium]